MTMHFFLSKRLSPSYTFAAMALTPNTVTRFIRVPFCASKVFPCQRVSANSASCPAFGLPGSRMAVPFASPFGMGPAGLWAKSASSSSRDILRRSFTPYGIASSVPALELQREVKELLVVPIDRAKVRVRSDLPDLIADVMRDDRGLRVVEDDGVLVVDQTVAGVDLGQNGFRAGEPEVVDERAVLRIEDL